MNIAAALRQAEKRLQETSDSALLDAQILLAHVLQVRRSYLFTWPEQELTSEQMQQWQALLKRRLAGEPVAYLTTSREFWSLDFTVNEHTLIPRPETELLVEKALGLYPHSPTVVADLGTGSGVIAISLAHERPQWRVLAIDKSPRALEVARQNAKKHHISNIEFIENDWLSNLSLPPLDLIVANPPYIACDDPELARETIQFEPTQALIANDDGMADIKKIVSQAQQFLKPGGWLLLEHGYRQGASVRTCLKDAGFENIETIQDIAGLDRMSTGQIPNIN